MADRPKLLFLAFFFPPLAVGSTRPRSVARHLVRLGWDVTVVTPHPSVWRHVDDIEVADSMLKRDGIKRIFTGHSWRCLDPYTLNCRNTGLGWIAGGVCRRVARRFNIDSGIGWLGEAEKACSVLKPKEVDLILATGAPFSAFNLAKRISDRIQRPYVLDYRDPWTGNPHVDGMIRPAVRAQEARLLGSAAAVTIVSPSWASSMDARFGVGSKLHVLTNGYDAEDLTDVQPHDFGHFAIVYTGNFYPPKRVITPLIAALKAAKEELDRRGEWYFHYYGRQPEHVREEAARFGVSERVKIHGRVSRREALAAVQGAGVAVVITSVDEEADAEERGIVPAKVFESIGLGVPTLLIAPANSDVEAIAESTGFVRRFSGANIDGISRFLLESMSGSRPPSKDRDQFAWTTIARKFDAVLRGAISAN